ncbi:cytochrome c oxidase subunit 3 [Rhizobium mesoamericanum]|uniref:Cytochrome-c oxidase subunit III protein n=1 Tax=Rhizobium mesoamericanum STM3625 TaxID=1211777 RepID=K0Q1J5_9HYPH|nr:cytochrome c oxidase subunit 3 [Rhizobium mesoamericanum]CCM76309.1 Cytochrome-c oxidase subunit III protein [Rhizobium mesoamericanum STM3625]
MSVVLIFLAGIASIVIWWLSRQRLMSKPWLEVGTLEDIGGPAKPPIPTAKIGLAIFLAVVGALFSLLASAYLSRMGGADWWAIPIPRLLWANTAVLIASCAALQWTVVQARRGASENVPLGLDSALATAVLFLSGQLVAWLQLVAAGYVLADNPANSFFYMLTGLHGLHILGGLAVLARTRARLLAGGAVPSARLRLGIELCATYWHFMLVVWLLLFALFTGWANDFVDLCRQLVS